MVTLPRLCIASVVVVVVVEVHIHHNDVDGLVGHDIQDRFVVAAVVVVAVSQNVAASIFYGLVMLNY